MKRRVMALFLALTMLIGMAPGVFAADTGFSDVAADAWYAQAVKWAVDNNITGGIGNGMFGPDNTCTRGQVVTFLWAAAGKPVMENTDNPFEDVSASDWYYNAVMWAVSNNITGGTSATTFSPEAPCTRAAVVTFLYAAEGKPAIENAKNDFVDVGSGDWFYAPVVWAVANNITGGIGNGCFGPDNACTRAQIALFLYKASLVGGSDVPVVPPVPELTPVPEIMNVKDASDAIAQLAASDSGYKNALSELTEKSTNTIEGDSYYRLQQNYKGIPVYGRTVVCATDENGNVMSVTGNVADVTGDVDMIPTVTAEQVKAAVDAYFGGDANTQMESLSADDLCIYNMGENGETRLAYCIESGGYAFLVDAKDAKVLLDVLLVYEEVAVGYEWTDEEKDNGFPIEKKGENEYILHDLTRNIQVYNLNFRNSFTDEKKMLVDFTQALVVKSDNNIFGDTEQERVLLYDDAVNLQREVQQAYDFFKGVGYKSPYKKISLYYNDTWDNGENGYATNIKDEAIISMGNLTGVWHTDVIAHEYTHLVSRDLVGWNGKNENGAINEALSDIFGEILEYKTYTNCDWTHHVGKRNIIHPEKSTEGFDNNGTRHPTVYKGEDWYSGTKDEGGVHLNSTVISHAAYLMSTDDGGKLTMDELGELWYRAMLMMPSDCDFYTCRSLVELAAANMELTAEQRECISLAFDRVGVKLAVKVDEAVFNVHPYGTVNVYDIVDKLYGNYTLEMTLDLAYEKPLKFGKIGLHQKNFTVDTPGEFSIPVKWGLYHCKLVDSADPRKTEEFYINITFYQEDHGFDIYTGFGGASVTGSVEKTKIVGGEQSQVPVYGAVLGVYTQMTHRLVDIIYMEDDAYTFAFGLATGAYTLEVSVNGSVLQKTDITVLNEDIEVNIVLEGEVDTNEEAYKAYVPMVEQAIRDTKKGWSDAAVEDNKRAQGYLADLDDDGIDELLMCYYKEFSVSGGKVTQPVYSLYDYEDGELVKVVERKRLIEAWAGGEMGSAAVVSFDGKPTVMIMDNIGSGGGPGVTHLYNYEFYDYPSMERKYLLGYWQEEGEIALAKEKFYINNAEVTKAAFLADLERCPELKFSQHGYNFYKGDPMSLKGLLDVLQRPVAESNLPQ